MKTLSGPQSTAVDAAAVGAVWLFEFGFDTPLYLTWSGVDIDYGGNTYRSAMFLEIEQVRETVTLEAVGLKATITGVPESIVSLALQENIRGDDFYMRLALLDSDGQIIGTPTLEYQGRCDIPTIADNPDDKGVTCVVSIAIESRIVDYARANIRRYTDQDQQKVFPGDKFFQYTPQMVEKSVAWPAASFWKS